MKTKHILTALALPALFAACTAEDIVSENNGLLQAERAKLSKDFVLNTNNGVESRYAVVGTTNLEFVYNEGDKIGANLIDKPSTTNDDPSTWDIVPYVAPALPFSYVGENQWKSEGELGIGNYLFTYPFNPKDGGRLAAQFELPRVQQYDAENPNAIIAANNKAVGATVLKEGDTEAKVAMRNLYTYPKIRINFDNGEKVTKVTKVVLKDDVSGFIYKGGIDHKKVANMFKEKTIKDLIKNKTYADEKEYWAAQQTSNFVINASSDNEYKAYGLVETSPYLAIELDEAVSVDASTNNKYVDVRLMLPSIANFSTMPDANSDSSCDTYMYIVTDNGTYKLAFYASASSFVFNATTSEEAIEKALWRSKSNTLKTVAMTMKQNSGSDLGNIVTTAADWNKLVEIYGNAEKYNGKGTNGTLAISILSKDFSLTKDLKMPKVAVFAINTPVSVEGEVALSNIQATTVNVEKGAALTTSGSFTASIVNVEETASLTFAAKLNDKDEVVEYTGVQKVVNEGTVTVPAGVVATFELDNKMEGTVNVGKAASRAAAIAEANIKGYNAGIINNNGKLTVIKGQTFTNNAPSTAAGYEYDEENVWEAAPTVNNNGTYESKGTTVNLGMFVNADKLTSNFGGGSFENGAAAAAAAEVADPAYVAILDIKAGAFTFIDSNYSTIVLGEATPDDLTIYSGAVGIIKHTAAAKEIDLSKSLVNHLIADGDIAIKKTYIDTKGTAATTDDVVMALPVLEMIGGGEIVVNTTDALLTKLIITEGKSTIGNEFTIETVEIAEGAELTIPTDGKLNVASSVTTVDGWITTNGILYIDGTLNVPGVKSSDPKNDLVAKIDENNSKLNIEMGKQSKVTSSDVDTMSALETLVKKYWQEAGVKTVFEDHTNPTRKDGQDMSLNPYDVEMFAKFIVNCRNWDKIKQELDALYNADNWNLAADKQTEPEVLKKLEANYTDFASYVTKYIIGTNSLTDAEKKTEKAKYIGEDGALIEKMAGKVTHDEKIYASKDRAMKDLIGRLIGDENPTFDKFQTAKVAYSLLTADDLYTALGKTVKNTTELTEEAAGWVDEEASWTANFAYVWADATTCPLYEVVSTANDYKLTDWNKVWEVDEADKIAGDEWTYTNIAAWINAASIYSDETTTKTMAKKYYNKDFKYIDAQVASVAAKLAE